MSNEKVKVSCPQCSANLNVGMEVKDKKIACPRCQYKFRLNFKASDSNMSSIIQANFETRENLDHSQGNVPGKQSQIALPPAQPPPTQSSSFSNSNVSNSSVSNTSASGSFSDSTGPIRTDWGKEHYTQAKRFKRQHSGLSRAQIYNLAKRRYLPLSASDEALQSTGVFLCIMAISTAIMPFFDLKILSLNTAGPIPAILSIVTAVIGILMIVIAQRKNPVASLGFGIGLLLMFTTGYIGAYDFFMDESPFRKNTSSKIETPIAEEVEEPIAEDALPPVEELGQGSNVVGGLRRQNNFFGQDGNANRNGDGNANQNFDNRDRANSIQARGPRQGGFKKIEQGGPIRPEQIDVSNFNPDDDRFLSENPEDNKRQENPLIANTVKSKEQLELEDELSRKEEKKKFLLGRKIAKMKSETFFNGKPSIFEFSKKYQVTNLMGKVATVGVAYLTDQPVVGFDFVDRGSVRIKMLVPFVGQPEFSSSIYSPDGSQIRGLVGNFRKGILSGIQSIYGQDGDPSLYQGRWAGAAPQLGKMGEQITSGNQPVYGFLIYTVEDDIVGVALVVKK